MRWFFKPGVDMSINRWPLVDGFFQFTEAMDPTEKCDRHPNLTFSQCWVEWFRGRGIKTQVNTQKVNGQAWVAVYRENLKSGRGSTH